MAGHENYEIPWWPNRSGVRQRLLQFLESALVGRVVAKPFLAATDEGLTLRNPRVVNVVQPTQGYGDRMLFVIRDVALG